MRYYSILHIILCISSLQCSIQSGAYILKNNNETESTKKGKNIALIDDFTHKYDDAFIKGYIKNCADFWLPTFDKEQGGFFSYVNKVGEPVNSKKTMLTQSRNSYGLVRAFMITGNTNYLEYAKKSLSFMIEHAWDNNNGGWFNELNQDGSLELNGEHNNDKWSFMQHYSLLGLSAYTEATSNEKFALVLSSGRDIIDGKLWDSRPGFMGYYETANLNWSDKSGKGFKSNMDAITAHLLSGYLSSPQKESKEKLLIAADNIITHFMPVMKEFKYGFPEYYDNDWKPDLNETLVFTGHLLNASWCLTRAYLMEPKPEYLENSNKLLKVVWEKGYDKGNGGCYANYNGLTGIRSSDEKEWWQLEEAFMAGIMNHYITKDHTALKMAMESLDFYMQHFYDEKNGEVFTLCSDSGKVINADKGFYWKAAYHSMEFGYYAYLYTNLYLNHKPVSLYYNFESKNHERNIKLTPIAIEDEKLTIIEITKDGKRYNNFSRNDRLISISPNESGVYKITFGYSTNKVNNE